MECAAAWNPLTATVNATAYLQTYEMDLVRPGQPSRRVLIQPRMLDHGYSKNDRLLVGVTDVTDERHHTKLNSMLLAEKAVLLQELQHRVANSLQIIASILLMSARRVQSEESRAHLQDAHGRVMSLAAVQQHLSASSAVDVEVRSYLERLCESLGASMIHDHMRINILVLSDAGRLSPQVSVSVGLIVTELVINCLKHAFPAGEGAITVSFKFFGSQWELSVGDDGIGMPIHPREAKAGLGTSLVDALAAQLGAAVSVTDGLPGTVVSVIQTSRAEVDQVRPV